MDIDLQPGRHVVAVSGGVDSMVLLQHAQPCDRGDTQPSRTTIMRCPRRLGGRPATRPRCEAKAYGLPFVYPSGRVWPVRQRSRRLRQARYDFLHHVRRASGAGAVVTAHHQDDLLETAILNLLRGNWTAWLKFAEEYRYSEAAVVAYVREQVIASLRWKQGDRWREDSTNINENYARNYVRHRILSRFAEIDREALLRVVRRAAELNVAIDQEVANYLHLQPAPDMLDRYEFTMLPHPVSKEVMAEWLLLNAQAELSRKMLERLIMAAKTGKSGTKADINKENTG